MPRYDQVTIGLEVSNSPDSETTTYPVSLASGNARIVIFAPEDREQALTAAKDLADFMAWPLFDCTLPEYPVKVG